MGCKCVADSWKTPATLLIIYPLVGLNYLYERVPIAEGFSEEFIELWIKILLVLSKAHCFMWFQTCTDIPFHLHTTTCLYVLVLLYVSLSTHRSKYLQIAATTTTTTQQQEQEQDQQQLF